jgi:hypothetical protein
MSQVLPTGRVPRRHVLLHAVCETRLLGGRDGRAGVGDRTLEAVLVDFLYQRGKGRRKLGDARREFLLVTYVDEEAGVLESSLLADLLHYFGFGVDHFGWLMGFEAGVGGEILLL